jgi:putative membrane protein
MSGYHYSRFIHENKEELTLRDYLAIDRTLLANERSFLAYVRTAFTLFIAAVSIIKFFDVPYARMVGEILMGISGLIFVQGLLRYRAMERVFAELEVIKQEADGPAGRHGLATRFLHLSQHLLRVFYR